jgi:hypothetical protein
MGAPAQTLAAAEQVLIFDDFNDNLLDTVMWEKISPFNYNAGVTVLEQNQLIEVQPLTSTAGLNTNGLRSQNTYDFRERKLMMEVNTVGSATGRALEMYAFVDVNNICSIILDGSNLNFRRILANVISDTTLTFSATNHRWWRIWNNIAASKFIWQTSADGISWSTQRSDAAFSLNMSSVKVGFLSGTFASNGAPGTNKIDNIRLS